MGQSALYFIFCILYSASYHGTDVYCISFHVFRIPLTAMGQSILCSMLCILSTAMELVQDTLCTSGTPEFCNLYLYLVGLGLLSSCPVLSAWDPLPEEWVVCLFVCLLAPPCGALIVRWFRDPVQSIPSNI